MSTFTRLDGKGPRHRQPKAKRNMTPHAGATATMKRGRVCLVAAIALIVALSGCFEAGHTCSQQAPWIPMWRTPGFFREVPNMGLNATTFPPGGGLRMGESADKLGVGAENFTIQSANYLVQDERPTDESVTVMFNGDVHALLRADRTRDDLETILATVNAELLRLPGADYEAFRDSFWASRTVDAASPDDVANFAARVEIIPALEQLWNAKWMPDALPAPGANTKVGQVDFRFDSWAFHLKLAIHEARAHAGAPTLTVDALNTSSLTPGTPTQESHSQVRQRLTDAFGEAGFATLEISNLGWRGQMECS